MDEVRLVSRRGLIAGIGAATALALAGCSGGSASASSGTGTGAGSSAASASKKPADAVERLVGSLSLERKVAQLFIVTPEQLTGVDAVTQAGDATRSALGRIPVGGICYFGQNITGEQQLRDLLAGTRDMAREAASGMAPFLTVDEEGGSLVARVANSGFFDVQRFPNMAQIGASGDTDRAAQVGSVIGGYLHDIGFNLDFAPVADVLTNPHNTVIGSRSFGSDPALVSSMVAAEVTAMAGTAVLPCAKHFPGHGDTAGDSHTGAVRSVRTRDQITDCELKPFEAAIKAGCPLIMVGHIETPNYAADGLPASLSRVMMHDVLREQLGFTGCIVSDSFQMGAITDRFGSADAAVRFLQAGGDIVLMPQDLQKAYEGVLTAVKGGSLSGERVDESVRRVLAAKQRAGLIA